MKVLSYGLYRKMRGFHGSREIRLLFIQLVTMAVTLVAALRNAHAAPSDPNCLTPFDLGGTPGTNNCYSSTPTDNCGSVDGFGVSDEKSIIVDAHNRLRTKVATGQETQGNPGPQPSASNMRRMVHARNGTLHASGVGRFVRRGMRLRRLRGGSKLYACNYGPAGNVMGLGMYGVGTPCTCCQSTCSDGVLCD
ncbi:unnamed protein product [Darwinula stevensoni]|uniref:SCP domain-containing protein n=1 Tax=Darwinula stevensoni TaxID=69355 RepID=A0A7R9A888_9CRUS|nr:unnamed protein product [Darwinula stevensoni]CAG0896155.1 unnamed protein product [Darwinula stevensoni]